MFQGLDTDVALDKSGCSVKVVRLRSQVRNESVRHSSSSTGDREPDFLF